MAKVAEAANVILLNEEEIYGDIPHRCLVLHAKESSDRLAPELELELDGQLPLSASGGRVVHRSD